MALLKPTFLLDKTKYTKYREKFIKKDRVKDRQTFLDIYGDIFREIGNELVERDGGVNITNFGYFFIWKVPRKRAYKTVRKGVGEVVKYNHHTDNYSYMLQFYPSNKHLKHWRMDNSFNSSLKKRVAKQLFSGKKYKMYLYSLKELLD